MRDIPDFDDRPWDAPDDFCEHRRSGYCFDCVRKRYNQEMLDGKFDDMDADYASTLYPSAYYEESDVNP